MVRLFYGWSFLSIITGLLINDVFAQIVPITPLKPNEVIATEQAEVKQVRAVIELNAGRVVQAEELLKEAYKLNPKSQTTLEYLAKLAQEKGDFTSAIQLYERALRLDSGGKKSELHFVIGSLYLNLSKDDLAQHHFEAALKDGFYPFETEYYLGFSLFRQQKWRQAERHFHNVEKYASKEQTPNQENILQATHYYLSQIYMGFGFQQYSFAEMESALQLGSLRMKKIALGYEDVLNRPRFFFTGGLLAQYDSNALLLNGDLALPSGLQKRGDFSRAYLLNFTAQSSPYEKVSYGGEYVFYMKQYSYEGFRPYDVWSNAPAVYLSFWNQKNIQLKLKYEYSYILTDSNAWSWFVAAHGPVATLSYFGDRRHQIDVSYSLKKNKYKTITSIPEDRTGNEHQLSTKLSFNGPNPILQPYFQYTYGVSDTIGIQYSAQTHSFEVGAAYPFGAVTRLQLSTSYLLSEFTKNVPGRRDQTFSTRLALTLPLFSQVISIFDAQYANNASTQADSFSYTKFSTTAGLIFTY